MAGETNRRGFLGGSWWADAHSMENTVCAAMEEPAEKALTEEPRSFTSLVRSLVSGVVGKPGVRLLEVTPETFAGKDEMLLGG